MSDPTILNIYSALWNPLDSYGRVAEETAKALERRGIFINRIGHGAPLKPIRTSLGGIYISPAGAYAKVASTAGIVGPRVGVTMFEGTHLPPDWVPVLNDCHEVVVTSQWLTDVFADNGVYRPISVGHLGISDVFKRPVKRNPRDRVFQFYATGDSGMRKGWHLAGWAFMKVFGNSTEHRLVYKSRHMNMPFSFQNENIQVIHADWSDRALFGFYASMHAMVFPTAGEGFGFPPREFAATGGPVAATAWSGTEDHIEEWGYPLPYRLVRAWQADSSYGDLGGRWAETNVDAMADWMQWVNDHRCEAFDKAEAAAETIKQLYTWDKFAEAILAAWNRASEQFNREHAKIRSVTDGDGVGAFKVS